MVLHCQRVQNNPPQVQSNAIQDNAVLKCISLEKLTNSSSPIEVGFSCIIWIKYNAVQESWIMTPAKHLKPKKLCKHNSILRVPLCTCTPTSTGVNIKLFACTFQNRQFQNHKRQFQNFYFRIRCSDIQDLEYGMPLMDSFRFVWQTFTPAPAEFLHFYWGQPMNM